MVTTRWGRTFRVALTVAAITLAPPVVFAQDQPKADAKPGVPIGKGALVAAGPLLDKLKTAENADAANALVAQIWEAWSESGDPGVELEMDEAISMMQLERYDQALALLDAVVGAAPDFAEGWNKRATVHFLMGDYDRSLADIQRTLVLEPRHFGAISGLALIATARGDNALALSAYQKVLEINPRNAGARKEVDELTKVLSGSPI